MNKVDTTAVDLDRRAMRDEGRTASASAADPRRAAPLDLSLGHFGKTDAAQEVDVVRYGEYVVTLDYSRLVAYVEVLGQGCCGRSERRGSARRVAGLLKTATQNGMTVSWANTGELRHE